jgi:ankyrin repeat protein
MRELFFLTFQTTKDQTQNQLQLNAVPSGKPEKRQSLMRKTAKSFALIILLVRCAATPIHANPRPQSRVPTPNCFHQEEEKKVFLCSSDTEKSQTKTQTSAEQATRDDPTNKKRCTPLMRASENGNLQAVRALLKNGADLNAKMIYGNTALMLAAKKGHLEVVEALLSAGADVNAPTAHTALTLAAAGGHLDVVKTLLSAGADPNIRGFAFHSGEFWALMSAMDRCNKDWLGIIDAMIASGAAVDPKAGFSRSPFMYAVEKHDVVMTKALMARGADINFKNVDGTTPLMVAVLGSSPEMVRFLIAADANVNARDLKGDTALAIVRQLKKQFPNEWQDEIIRLLTNAARLKPRKRQATVERSVDILTNHLAKLLSG